MGEGSPNRPALCEKHQTSCMWGLINIFDCRQVHATQKLLSNGGHLNKHVVEARSLGVHPISHPSSGEVSSDKLNLAAILEAFCNQIRRENGEHYSEVQRRITSEECDQINQINPEPVEILEENEEAFINQMFRKFLSKDCTSHQSQQFLDVLKVLNSDKELFLKLLQDPNSPLVKHIQHLRDLQPSKSIPEAKFSVCEEAVCTAKFQKQNMHNFLWNKIKSRYGHPSNRRENPRTPSRIVGLKPSMENSENVTCQYCSSVHHSLEYKCKRDKPRFFSFGDMKKKLKFAAEDNRKEQHRISTDGNLDQLPYEIGGKKATRKAVKSFSDAKTRDKIGRLRDSKSGIKPEISVSNSKLGDFDLYLEAKRHLSKRLSCVDQDGTLSGKEAPRTLGRVLSLPQPKASKSGTKPEISALNQSVCEKFSLSTVSYSKRRDFDIYLEAKRHLSERLSNVGQEETLPGKEAPRTLGRVLSLPQHEFLPTLSPNRDIEYGFATAQMRFSPYCNLQMTTDRLQKEEEKTSCQSSVRQNIEASPSDDQLQNSNSKPDMLVNLLPDTKGHESICSVRDDCSSVGYARSVETNDITSAKQSTDTANICEEVEYLECSRPDSPSENQQLSINKLEVGDCIKDRTEHSSPVSVLEPFSIEDVTSPPSTTIKPAKSPMQPLHIDFEEDAPEVSSPDPKIHFGSCNVEALLQGGCLNWDKLFLTWDSSDQLHCQSLFDELELPPTDSSCDPKLVFDCFNEVVSEVYQCYFGCSPCLSFLRPKMGPVPAEKMVVHELKKRVHQYLRPPMMPRTLEQLVGEDLASSGTTWMDIRVDTEDIVIDMVESILEELIAETMLEICMLQAFSMYD